MTFFWRRREGWAGIFPSIPADEPQGAEAKPSRQRTKPAVVAGDTCSRALGFRVGRRLACQSGAAAVCMAGAAHAQATYPGRHPGRRLEPALIRLAGETGQQISSRRRWWRGAGRRR